MYEPLAPRVDTRAEVRSVQVGGLPESRLRLVDRRRSNGATTVDEADVVVSGGDGVELETLAKLAAADGAVAVPSGMIGLLGRPVAPRLYVAVGVKDEPEHWAGAVKAAVIVSVGDAVPEAADVSIAGDFREVLHTLLDAAARNR